MFSEISIFISTQPASEAEDRVNYLLRSCSFTSGVWIMHSASLWWGGSEDVWTDFLTRRLTAAPGARARRPKMMKTMMMMLQGVWLSAEWKQDKDLRLKNSMLACFTLNRTATILIRNNRCNSATHFHWNMQYQLTHMNHFTFAFRVLRLFWCDCLSETNNHVRKEKDFRLFSKFPCFPRNSKLWSHKRQAGSHAVYLNNGQRHTERVRMIIKIITSYKSY